jgi:hypothetical protein
LRDGDRLLVLGLCPYLGVGPVFAYGWDLQHRIELETGARNVDPWFVTDISVAGAEGVEIRYPEGVETLVPYERLTLIDWTSGEWVRIASPQEGMAYFSDHPIPGSTGCPDVRLYGGLPY